MSKLRWGILGTGRIAGIFAEGLRSVDDAELAAVGSRTDAAAQAFGRRFGAARSHASYAALICGTAGQLRILHPWWAPSRMMLTLPGQPDQLIDPPTIGNGYNYEAIEVGRCLRAGRLESDVVSLDETLAITRTLDEVRAQWGLRYPSEAQH